MDRQSVFLVWYGLVELPLAFAPEVVKSFSMVPIQLSQDPSENGPTLKIIQESLEMDLPLNVVSAFTDR